MFVPVLIHVGVGVACGCGRNQKMTSSLWELELWVVVSFLVLVFRTQPESFVRAESALHY